MARAGCHWTNINRTSPHVVDIVDDSILLMFLDQGLQADAVIALQHHRIEIEQEVEEEQPAHGIKPAMKQGVADEQKHVQENEHM